MKDAQAGNVEQIERASPTARSRSRPGAAAGDVPEQLSVASSLRHFGVAAVPAVGTVAALAAWAAYGLAPRMQELILFVVCYLLNILGMELALHRYFAHRAFKASPAMKIVLAILGSLAYMGPLMWWVAIHRLHHANTDKPGDPHTPQLGGPGWVGGMKGFLHGHVGWLFDPSSARPRNWSQFANDMYRDPTLLRIHLAYDLWLLLGLLLPAAIDGLLDLSYRSALLGLLWGATVRIFFATNAIWAVNSVCHSVGGGRPFRGRDESRNVFWLAILTLGAGWHNNHHAFPQFASTGFRRWQIDITGWIVVLLERLGLIWDVQHPDRAAIEKKRASTRDES